MRRRNITVPDILWERMQIKADSLGVSVSEIIRRGVEDYLEKRDGKSTGLGESKG